MSTREEEKDKDMNAVDSTYYDDAEQWIRSNADAEREALRQQQEALRKAYEGDVNPYDAMKAAHENNKKKYYDPKADKARKSVAALYDALQLIGTFGGMGGFGGFGGATPQPPKLTSAMQNAVAVGETLRERQRVADEQWQASLDRLNTDSSKYLRSREDNYRKQMRAIEDGLLDVTRRENKAIGELRADEHKEEDRWRRTAYQENERAKRAANGKSSGGSSGSSDHIITIDGKDYRLPKNRIKSFDAAAKGFMNDYDIEPNRGEGWKTDTFISILINAVNDETDPDAQQAAYDILNDHFGFDNSFNPNSDMW